MKSLPTHFYVVCFNQLENKKNKVWVRIGYELNHNEPQRNNITVYCSFRAAAARKPRCWSHMTDPARSRDAFC